MVNGKVFKIALESAAKEMSFIIQNIPDDVLDRALELYGEVRDVPSGALEGALEFYECENEDNTVKDIRGKSSNGGQNKRASVKLPEKVDTPILRKRFECSGCGGKDSTVNRDRFDGLCVTCTDAALYDSYFANDAIERNNELKKMGL